VKKAAGEGTVARDEATQRLGSDPSLSPGACFPLRDFTGENYSRGRPWPVRLLWMLVSRCVTMQWWCPNRLRVFTLRRFGARIGTGTLRGHDVKSTGPGN
jgi:hypothetical protein